MIASTNFDILRFVQDRTAEGVASVLVTLVGIDGTSPRALGAQMAVAADGRYLGSFTGGCIEAAVVAEAIDTLNDGRGRQVRFGAGSPYIDIRLPCGSGIDLLFNPAPAASVIGEALARCDRRVPAALRLGLDGIRSIDPAAVSGTGWQGDDFLICYPPGLRLVALGQGEELVALARLARGFGADVQALSPDPRTLTQLTDAGCAATRLDDRALCPDLGSDPWTAIVFLFHDRDWEEYLLPHALQAPAFYVGAIGSRRTQGLRGEALAASGLAEPQRQRLRTSVGLIPATRDPATLALSILAQLVEEYQCVDWAQSSAEAVVPAGNG